MRCIWIDADACSRVARNIAIRLAKRTNIQAMLVANHQLSIRETDKIHVILCGPEKNAADHYIHAESKPKDIAVCRDIELIKQLLAKGLSVLNDRGKIYTTETITFDSLRRTQANFVHSELGFSSPPTQKKGKTYSHEFASALDHLVNRCT